MNADLLITNANLITCASPHGPKRGAAMQDVGQITDGALAISGDKIIALGPSAEVRAQVEAARELDVDGRAVCPGFVDAHTHAVYAGDRVAEFEMRIKGASYMEIMAAGGGILSTMRAVRQADVEQLVAESLQRLDVMLHLGTTTAEIKTGYGLSTAAELNMLQAIAELDADHAMTLIPTFLGAHAVPPAFKDDPDAYVQLVITEMLPVVAAWYERSHFPQACIPLFADVFCEEGAFDLDQTRQVLEAAQAHGMALKLHADEFVSLGGVSLAAGLGATSVDHLDATPPAEMQRLAASDTVGVILPAVNFNLGSHHFADARALIDAGVALALATDINPGSAPCPSLPLAMAIACRYQRLLPNEVLNAVTINAAHAVGLGQRLGSLEVGKQADVLILDTHDHRHLAYEFGRNHVAQVVKAGKMV